MRLTLVTLSSPNNDQWQLKPQRDHGMPRYKNGKISRLKPRKRH